MGAEKSMNDEEMDKDEGFEVERTEERGAADAWKKLKARKNKKERSVESAYNNSCGWRLGKSEG